MSYSDIDTFYVCCVKRQNNEKPEHDIIIINNSILIRKCVFIDNWQVGVEEIRQYGEEFGLENRPVVGFIVTDDRHEVGTKKAS